MFPALVAIPGDSVWRARPAVSSLRGGMLTGCEGNRDAACRSHWIRGDAEECASEIVFGIENWALGCLMDLGVGGGGGVESGVGLLQD